MARHQPARRGLVKTSRLAWLRQAQPPAPYRARRSRRRAFLSRRDRLVAVLVLLGLVAVVVGLAGGVTVALLSASAASQGAKISSGDLEVTLGEPTWQQATPGVAPGASGTTAPTPADFLSMPGDVIEIRVPVTTFLLGDNLVANLTVGYTAPSATDVEITAVFHLEDAAGAQVAPASGDASAGTTLSVFGLVGSEAGVTTSWTVVVRVEVLGDYQWFTPASPDPQIDWSAGTVRATLDQVRLPLFGPAGGAG